MKALCSSAAKANIALPQWTIYAHGVEFVSLISTSRHRHAWVSGMGLNGQRYSLRCGMVIFVCASF